MSQRTNRRKFLKTTTAVGAGYWVAGGVAPKQSIAANEQIAFAAVGVGGKGTSDSNDASRNGDMVAICDIDETTLGNAAKRFPKAKKFMRFCMSYLILCELIFFMISVFINDLYVFDAKYN